MLSLFDFFKVGIGPSSSHTVGPMIAAARFAALLEETGALGDLSRLEVDLYGSLALTGLGHGTDKAVLMGLEGHRPHMIDPDIIDPGVARIRQDGQLSVNARRRIDFDIRRDLVFHFDGQLPFHSNGMTFRAVRDDGTVLLTRSYYSIGGGFVVDEDEAGRNSLPDSGLKFPFEFETAAQLLELGRVHGKALADMVLANELVRLPLAEINAGIDRILQIMEDCIDRGCQMDGILPGGLDVDRRAAALWRKLQARQERALSDPLSGLDWINLWALAVNEENAAGGRVVTAPTNGAAGILPAVLRYYDRFCNGTLEGRRRFLLTATAIAVLFKRNASISGAEVGCQGEVGVACSMAAAGLTAALGGSNEQIENAAEIGMEHNLGLTCDPIGGLVQIPCIERNAMGAVKAIDASRLAMLGNGGHKVSLDKVIEVMRQTGLDMSVKYKETAQGGLALNAVEC